MGVVGQPLKRERERERGCVFVLGGRNSIV